MLPVLSHVRLLMSLTNVTRSAKDAGAICIELEAMKRLLSSMKILVRWKRLLSPPICLITPSMLNSGIGFSELPIVKRVASLLVSQLTCLWTPYSPARQYTRYLLSCLSQYQMTSLTCLTLMSIKIDFACARRLPALTDSIRQREIVVIS